MYNRPDLLEYCEVLLLKQAPKDLPLIDEIRKTNLKAEIWDNYNSFRFGDETWGEDFVSFVDNKGKMQFQLIIKNYSIPYVMIVPLNPHRIGSTILYLGEPTNPHSH